MLTSCIYTAACDFWEWWVCNAHLTRPCGWFSMKFQQSTV